MTTSTETRFERRLQAALDRVTCPDPQELGEHRLGHLSAERSEAVIGHLAICPRCREEVALFNGFVPMDASVLAELGVRNIVTPEPRHQQLWLQVMDAVSGERKRLSFALGELGALLDRAINPGALGSAGLVRSGTAALAAGQRGAESPLDVAKTPGGDSLTYELQALEGPQGGLRLHGTIDDEVADGSVAELVLDDGTVLARGQIEYGTVDLRLAVPAPGAGTLPLVD